MFECRDIEECFSEPDTEIEDFFDDNSKNFATKETNLKALLEEGIPRRSEEPPRQPPPPSFTGVSGPQHTF